VRKKRLIYVLEQITCRISSQNKVKTHTARINSLVAGRVRRPNPYETVLLESSLPPIDTGFATILLSLSSSG